MSAFINLALFMVSIDFGFLLVSASGAYPQGILDLDLNTRIAFGVAGAILGGTIAILFGLSAELSLALSLVSAVFGAMPHALSQLAGAVIPGSTDVEVWLVLGLDTLFAAIYVVLVLQLLSRQQFNVSQVG